MVLIPKIENAELTATRADLNNLPAWYGNALRTLHEKINPTNLRTFKPITSSDKLAANIFLYDNHFGEKVNLPGSNQYDFDIADTRMDQVFDYSVDHMNTIGLENFDEINILIGGDNVDGDGSVYPGQGGHIVGDIAVQMTRFASAVLRNVARLNALYSNNIAIHIAGIPGNHGNSKAVTAMAVHQRANNHDIQTYKYMELFLLGRQNLGVDTNVSIDFNYNSEFLTVPVKGWNFLMLHKTANTMTTPNSKVKALGYLQNHNAHMLITGHFHETQLASIGDYKMVRVGSMAGPNSYSDTLGILRNRPEQLLIITSTEEMIKSFHPIVLS